MYLPDLVHRDPPAAAGRFRQAILGARQTGRPVPGIYYLFAANPAMAKPLCDLMQALMRGPSELSPGLRETIAAFTSAQNHCLF